MLGVYSAGMTISTPLEHGGNLAAAERLFGAPNAPWIDLSTGINPRTYPDRAVSEDAYNRLPDIRADQRLRDAARRYYGVSDPAALVLVPGTQAALQWLPRLRERCRVAIVGPTYEEHAHTWANAGHAVSPISSLDEGMSFDVVVVVNPNNPDGRIVEPDHLVEAASHLDKRGGWLIVDEAFGDVCTQTSVVDHVETRNIIVLKSVGKFFGLAGLRLGFVVSGPALGVQLSEAVGPWAVSGPAMEIGARAMADGRWINDTRDWLAVQTAKLDTVLKSAGLSIIGGTSLYRLAHHDQAQRIYEHLARNGLLVRRFPYNARWLRFGIPGDDKALKRVSAVLEGM